MKQFFIVDLVFLNEGGQNKMGLNDFGAQTEILLDLILILISHH